MRFWIQGLVIFGALIGFSATAIVPSNSPTTKSPPVCKDGKGPLLEGEGSPFPCAGECPEGFDCEMPSDESGLGICCPNLDILYDLYGKNASEEDTSTVTAETATPTTTLGTKETRELKTKFDDSWQETSESPELLIPAVQSEAGTTDGDKDKISPDNHLLKYLKAKEVRLSRDKLPVHRAAPNTDAYSNPINPLNPENLKDLDSSFNPEAFKQRRLQSENQKFTGEISCKRQKFESQCEGGEKKTQVVLRWFAMKGECCSYPYGYCPGTTIKEDKTLRTKEECEIFCLSNQTMIEKSFQNTEAPESSSTVPAEPLQPSITNQAPEVPPSSTSSEPLSPTPSPKFPTLANPIQGEVSNRELEEVFPPGYGPEIDEANQTRVILHSEIQEPIPIAPPNAESHAHAKELTLEMMTAAEPPVDKKNETSEDQIANAVETSNSEKNKNETAAIGDAKMSGSQEPKVMEIEMITEASKIEPKHEALKPSAEEPRRTLGANQRVAPKKSCQKLLPYRSMCPSGMPSQFTLRWYVKSGMCCAYPFGYCHGESVFEEAAIKTKQECEELCLGRIDSEKPYYRLL